MLVILTLGLILSAFLCYSESLTESREFSHFPDYRIAKRGDSVTFQCASLHGKPTVYWKKDENTLYNGIDVTNSSKYSATKDGFSFSIYRVESSDAGTYRCEVIRNGGAAAATQEKTKAEELIVLDSSLEWKINISSTRLKASDVIVISCQFLYYGKFLPYIQCLTTQSKQIPFSSDLSHNETISARNASLSLEISLEPKLNDQAIVCGAYLMQNLTKKNALLSLGNWTTPILNILYKPLNLRLEPAAEFYHVDETVTCEADGNPDSFEVQWVNANTGSVVEGSEMKLDSHGTFTYICNVTNAVGSSTVKLTIKVKAKGTENGRLTTVIVVSVTSALLTFAFSVTAIIVLCIKNRNIRQKLLDQQQQHHYVNPAAAQEPAPATASIHLPTIYEAVTEDGSTQLDEDYGEIQTTQQVNSSYAGLIQEDRVLVTGTQPYTTLFQGNSNAQEAAAPENDYEDQSRVSPDYVNYGTD